MDGCVTLDDTVPEAMTLHLEWTRDGGGVPPPWLDEYHRLAVRHRC
jgi:hypothetical protein